MDNIKIQTNFTINIYALARDLELYNKENKSFEGIVLPNQEDRDRGFSLSPETASLIITGISNLVLLINALLLFIQKRREGTIEVVSRSGKKLVFDKNTSKEEIEYLIKVAKQLDDDDIRHIIVEASS